MYYRICNRWVSQVKEKNIPAVHLVLIERVKHITLKWVESLERMQEGTLRDVYLDIFFPGSVYTERQECCLVSCPECTEASAIFYGEGQQLSQASICAFPH